MIKTEEETKSALELEYPGSIDTKHEGNIVDRIIYKFGVLIIDYPLKVIGIFLILLTIIVIIDAFYFELDSINEHAYFVTTDLNVNRMDALTLAEEYIAKSNTVYADIKTQEIDEYTLVMMYKTTNSDQSIFTPNNIQWILSMNDEIVSNDFEQYYSLCLTDLIDDDNNSTNFPDCSSSNARTDPLFDAFGESFMNNNITQNEIDLFFENIVPEKSNDLSFLTCFDPDFVFTNFSRYYRMFYRFGLPYPDINDITSSFQNSYDNREKQDDFYIDYIFPIYQDLQVNKDEEYSAVEIVIGGWLVRGLQFDTFAPSGIVFAVGSGISVLVIMSIHLNSIFLSVFGLIQICFAFPFAYFVYRFMVGIIYFDAMQLLIIFVILGIGADDCFVFVDAFIQSSHLVKKENGDDEHELLLQRMIYAYTRAAKAMLVTTLTTAFAFAATALSPLIPISAFGIWATFCVIMNYLLVISFYPCIVSLHYQYIQKYEKWKVFKSFICCCCNKKKKDDDQNEKDELLTTKTTSNPTDYYSDIDQNDNYYNIKEPRRTEKFFRDKFAPFVIRFKYTILVLFIGLFSVATYFAVQIQGLTEEENWFPTDHYMQKMIEWPNDYYGGAVSELINERFIWGIEQWVNKDNVNSMWDVNDWGEVEFDDTFDLSSGDAQQHIIYVCDSLINNYSQSLFDPDNTFDCFMYYLRDYGVNELGLQFPFIFDDMNKTNQSIQFTNFIYEWTHFDDIGKRYLSDGKVGYDGTENILRYVYISFLLDEKRYISASEKDKVWQIWEDIMNGFNNEAPNGVDNGYQIDTFAFAWAASEVGFVTSAIQGISIAMPCALICLVISTQNWIISLFAVLSIIGIIVCELAVMVIQDWELGTAESIAVVIMIGFSVDYVVHLGNAYIECSDIYLYKHDRLKYSLFTMAISVLSGAITTFTSAFWLIFPIFMFYKKFSILVMTTSTFSLLFALFFFMSLLAICGPNNNTGYIFNLCNRKKKQKQTTQS